MCETKDRRRLKAAPGGFGEGGSSESPFSRLFGNVQERLDEPNGVTDEHWGKPGARPLIKQLRVATLLKMIVDYRGA